ncbi:MAG TPA: hypothetical protein VHS78_13345 [Candidatus Elarobacter sp.]|jgi:hypothetical protein|nr:hypothetical protein [Candidatus Elarobacter sp.]
MKPRLSALAVAVAVLCAVPVDAQSGGGHGALYYSRSMQRIGWARDMGSDDTADSLARDFCAGGLMDADMNRANQNSQAGASPVTVAGRALNAITRTSDCVKVIKFDNRSDHPCAGIGFSESSRSNGSRGSRSEVERELGRSWTSGFVVCNDRAPLIGFERLGPSGVVQTATPAPGLVACNTVVTPGRVLVWRSFNPDGSQHATGTMTITTVSGGYFEATQATVGGSTPLLFYGVTSSAFAGFVNPSSHEAWAGRCTVSGIDGNVKAYRFTMTPR